MSIQERIAEVQERLTPTERRIATMVLDDPTSIAFGSVSDIADRAETSRPSVVRFATKLGFGGYTDLQAWIREDVSEKLSSPRDRIRRQSSATGPIHLAVVDALHHAFTSLDERKLASLAKPIVDARRVWIVSGETSRAGAHALLSGLSMVRPDVRLIDEHGAARDLANAGAQDVGVIIDFARYRRIAASIAKSLTDIGVPIVAITDSPLSPLASITPNWCELRVPAVGPFDSSVPAVIAAELLTARVVEEMGDAAREHVDRLEAMWQRSGTFLPQPQG